MSAIKESEARRKAAEQDGGFWVVILRGVFAGWLIALMPWLIMAATRAAEVVLIFSWRTWSGLPDCRTARVLFHKRASSRAYCKICTVTARQRALSDPHNS